MIPDIVSIGEGLVELNVVEPGPLRTARQYKVGWGGDTSNFVVAASHLGGRAGYITRVGADEFGQMLLDLWQTEGIDTSHVVIEPEGFTGIYFIARQGATHSFTYYRKDSAASHLKREDVPEDYIARAQVLHVSGITQAISQTACDAVSKAIGIARSANVRVSYDPNVRSRLWDLERARGVVLETIQYADFVFPSREDAELILGQSKPTQIAEQLLAWGARTVILKLGSEGALLATRYGEQRFAPFRVKVVDTTGAGDTFAGAFMVAYVEGKSLVDCARSANAAAALATTGAGAVEAIPRRAQVEAFLQSK